MDKTKQNETKPNKQTNKTHQIWEDIRICLRSKRDLVRVNVEVESKADLEGLKT